MKFISCYIAGFGKWRNQSFDLSKDVVEIKAENGFGKTTLLNFLECMLFGMDAGRNKAVEDNLRGKYLPFDGGVYGGTLTFSYRGQTYRIERTFGRTPAMDTVKLYDKNNMQSFAFGEKIERLGELILGVNKETYHRSAYLPQGGAIGGELPENTKARLLQLLTTGDSGGIDLALARLEEAEKKLRAKRKPSKGKLDEIEEDLIDTLNKKTDCLRAAQTVKGMREKLNALEARLQYLNDEHARLSAILQEELGKNERAAQYAMWQEVQTNIAREQEELRSLQAFFAGNDPLSLNVVGLQERVQEFYALQAWLDEHAETLRILTEQKREKELLVKRMQDSKEKIASFEKMLLAESKTTGAGTHSNKKDGKKRRKNTNDMLSVSISLLIAVFGATQIEALPILGIPLVVLGGLSIAWTLLKILFTPWGRKKQKQATRFDDEELNKAYEEAQKEWENLQFSSAEFDEDIETRARDMQIETEQKQAKAETLKNAIEQFLANFQFQQAYDYRAAIELLQERINRYQAHAQTLSDYQARLQTLPQPTQPIVSTRAVDIQNLKAQIFSLDNERRQRIEECTKARVDLQTQEEYAARVSEYKAEETRLYAEKERYERRLLAVQTAKKVLEQTRDNLSARYLEPVEKGTLALLERIGIKKQVCFSADGQTLVNENGIFRASEYYSAGTQDLFGFCMRIALAGVLFRGEKPPLILDDPFTNFDDFTTDACKKLVKALSKEYQIIYCTCKEERRL